MIREMERKDAKECAQLHKDSIENAFLCELGISFLEKFYEVLVNSRDCNGYVYIGNLGVIGFITGSRNMNRFFRSLILGNFFALCPIVLSRLVAEPKLIRSVIETFLYLGKSEVGNVKSELVSIVVKKDYRGRGIGRRLLNELVKSFRESDTTQFKVMVDRDNIKANEFYKALGFEFFSTFNMYNKYINLYTYSVK